MPVFLMLDMMLDLMLDRVHTMTHVALRASSEDDVANLVAFAKGAASRRSVRHTFVMSTDKRSFGTIASPSVEQAPLAQQLEERVLASPPAWIACAGARWRMPRA